MKTEAVKRRQKFVEYLNMSKLQVSHAHIIKTASVKEGCLYKNENIKRAAWFNLGFKCNMQDEL